MADARRPEFNSDQLAEVRRLQGLYPDKRGALLPVLRLAQETFGYVSLEVDPDIAFDTQRTMEQAREYWGRVDRPNLMIKIPATPAGMIWSAALPTTSAAR